MGGKQERERGNENISKTCNSTEKLQLQRDRWSLASTIGYASLTIALASFLSLTLLGFFRGTDTFFLPIFFFLIFL